MIQRDEVRDQGSGFRFQVSGFRGQGVESRGQVLGLGIRLQGTQ
jgi:hypothetical protein